MARFLNSMDNTRGVQAELALEINANHPIAAKLTGLAAADPEKLKKYARLLYAQARMIGGLPVEDPAALSDLICELML